jgi:hypothetical protein
VKEAGGHAEEMERTLERLERNDKKKSDQIFKMLKS